MDNILTDHGHEANTQPEASAGTVDALTGREDAVGGDGAAEASSDVSPDVSPEAAAESGDVIAIHRGKKLRGTLTFPGDAHQAMYACALAALGTDATRLGNPPEAPWFAGYRAALEALGVAFETADDDHLLVRGPRDGLTAPVAPLEVRHELAALILAGLCSGRGLAATLRIDRGRVPADTIAVLKTLWPGPIVAGARAAVSDTAAAAPSAGDEDEHLDFPVGALNAKARGLVKPYERLAKKTGEETAVKIALLFHHLAAGESLELHLRRQGPDLLENLLLHFEVPLRIERDDDKEADELTRRIARQMRAAGKEIPVTRLRLPAGARPAPTFLTLAGDVTEAAAAALAATLIKSSDVLLENVLLNTGRAAFFAALRRMGGDVEVTQRRERFGETQGTIRIRTSELFGKRFDADTLTDTRDEVFLLLAAAAYAEGESVFRDLHALRQGPVDFLREFTAALKRGGVDTGEIEDGVVIRGRPESDGAALDAWGHAGIAAACVVMALKSHGASTVAGARALADRYPGLLTRLRSLEGSGSTASPAPEKSA